MQQPDDPRMLVIALQGLPITIALLLSFEHQPVTEKHLCSMLSKTDKTVASALHKLNEFQMITRTTQGWMISTTLQLPLTLALTQPVDNFVENNRKNSDYCSSGSVVVDSRDQQIHDESTTTTIKESELFRLLKQTCEAVGIHEPKSSKIARIPNMTEHLIKSHVSDVLAEGLSIGAAIFRLENQWPVKPDPNEVLRKKYSLQNSKYASWFNNGDDDV